MYATNGQTDGQTKATFIASFPTGGGITILLRYAIAARVANKQEWSPTVVRPGWHTAIESHVPAAAGQLAQK